MCYASSTTCVLSVYVDQTFLSGAGQWAVQQTMNMVSCYKSMHRYNIQRDVAMRIEVRISKSLVMLYVCEFTGYSLHTQGTHMNMGRFTFWQVGQNAKCRLYYRFVVEGHYNGLMLYKLWPEYNNKPMNDYHMCQHKHGLSLELLKIFTWFLDNQAKSELGITN